MLRSAWRRSRRRFRLDLGFHAGLVRYGRFLDGLTAVGSFRVPVIVCGDNGLRVGLINGRLLLADLASGLRLVLRLFFTALHALAHPVAHASVCNTSS